MIDNSTHTQKNPEIIHERNTSYQKMTSEMKPNADKEPLVIELASLSMDGR